MYSRESALLLGELLVLKVLGDEGIKDGGLEELAVACKTPGNGINSIILDLLFMSQAEPTKIVINRGDKILKICLLLKFS